MNALEQARTAYASPVSPIRTERGTEYEAIARVTTELRLAAKGGPGEFRRLVDALHRNRQLWTLIAGSVSDGRNELPPDLRARLFYLAEFTLRHTREVLSKRAGPDALVEINTAVMQGLRAGEAAQTGEAGK